MNTISNLMEVVDIRPSTRDVDTYLSAISAYNQSLHQKISRKIRREVPALGDQNNDFCLVTTGSDGRHEKSPESRMELILLNGSQKNSNSDIENEIKKIMDSCKVFSNGVFEVRGINDGDLCFYDGDKDRVFPTRILDAKYLGGDPNLVRQAKLNAFEEILDGEKGRRIVRKFDKHRSVARKTLLNKGQSGVPHFDDGGNLFYDGERVKATKYGHLRSVQYKFASDMFKGLRRDLISPDFLSDLPHSTAERLNFISANSISSLSFDQIDDLVCAYRFALHSFHLAEENYVFGGSRITSVDPGEFKEATKVISVFANYDKNILK